MLKIFISYSHTDISYVKSLIPLLETEKWRHWYDRRLMGGDEWWDEILDNIQSCSMFMYILSPESTESPYCIEEYKYAQQCDLYIVPVRYDANFKITNETIKDLNEYQILLLRSEYMMEDFGELKRSFRKKMDHKELPLNLIRPPRPLGFLEIVAMNIENHNYGNIKDDIDKLWDALDIKIYREEAINLLEKLDSNSDTDTRSQKKIRDLLSRHGRTAAKKDDNIRASKTFPELPVIPDLSKIINAVEPRTGEEFITLSFRIQDCFAANELNRVELEELVKLTRLNVDLSAEPLSRLISAELAHNHDALASVLSLKHKEFSKFVSQLYQTCLDVSLEKAASLTKIPA